MDEILYSVNQVGLLLKVHPLTIRRYIKEGKLKAIKVAGNIRIPQSAIGHFSQEINPTSYNLKKTTKTDRNNVLGVDDAIFRLKGRGLSLRTIDY